MKTTIVAAFALQLDSQVPSDETNHPPTSVLAGNATAWSTALSDVGRYLGEHGPKLRQGTIADANINSCTQFPTKNSDGKRDPEMHETKKGNQYSFRHEGAHRWMLITGTGSQPRGTHPTPEVTQVRQVCFCTGDGKKKKLMCAVTLVYTGGPETGRA